MKKLNLLTAGLLFAGISLFAAGGDNLALQKEIIAKQAKIANNTNLIGPANIKKGVYNPAVNRRGSKNTVIVGMGNPPKGEFLPMYYSTSYDAPVNDLIFSGLLKVSESGELIPDIAAADPVISNNNRTYTFKLRKNIKFSDGKPLTSKDVVFTYKIMADPSYDGRVSYYADNLVGYKDYNSGKSEKISGLKALDDYTIQFTFKTAKVTNLTSLDMGILPEHVYKHKYGDLKPVKNLIRKPVGAGPYKLKKFAPRQYAELTRNNNYYDKLPKVKNIILKYVNDNVAVQTLLKGEIDMWPGAVKPEVLETANSSGFINRIQYLRHGYGYLNINCNDPIMKDINVRKALLYGLDRAAFQQIYFKGLAISLDTVVSVTWWMYDKAFHESLTSYPFNPAKAKKLLDEDGWKMGTDGFRHKDGKKLIVVWAAIKDSDIADTLMPILLQNWKQLGVDVKIKRLDFNSLMDLLYKERKGYSIANLGVSEAILPNPREAWHSSQNKAGGSNTAQFSTKKSDKLIEKIEQDFDKNKFRKDWQEWVKYMNEQVPRYMIYSNIYTDLFNDRIKNFNANPLYRWYYCLPDISIDNGK